MTFIKLLLIKRCCFTYGYVQQRNLGKYLAVKDLKRCYETLGVPEESNQEDIRSAYLQLVKRYHPDSGKPDADTFKFQEIDKAFRVLINKKARVHWDVDIETVNVDTIKEEYDIKHTTPQNRHYLSYDGMGYGTPFQREKQFTKIRAMHAAENVMQHRLQKATLDEKAVVEKQSQKHKIKTKCGIDRIVEDLIQEAMSKGEFDNLSGQGKPLPQYQTSNPYIDFVTQKLNQVLIDNGFTPEWIMLQKEIREEKNMLQRNLYKSRTTIGEHPLNDFEECRWNKILQKYEKDAKDINKKIEKYNLVVPVIQKQMLLVSLRKEAAKVVQYGQTSKDIEAKHASEKIEAQENPQNIFSFIESFFLNIRKHYN